MDRPCGRGCENYCRGWGDALPWRRCQVLVQAWSWRVKREAGASCSIPALPPQRYANQGEY